jgi:excisionase family DNA binding protein
MAEEWITTQEAAEIIGVSIKQVSHLLLNGRIKGKKFGRFWMVDKQSAEEYAASNRKPGPKPKTQT